MTALVRRPHQRLNRDMPRLVITSTLAMLLAVVARPAIGVETITFRDDDNTKREVVGEIMIEAHDGGVMLQADDGRIWMIQPEQVIERQSDDLALPAARQ